MDRTCLLGVVCLLCERVLVACQDGGCLLASRLWYSTLIMIPRDSVLFLVVQVRLAGNITVDLSRFLCLHLLLVGERAASLLGD